MACHGVVGGIVDDSGVGGVTCSSSVDAFSGDSSLDMVVQGNIRAAFEKKIYIYLVRA